MSWIENIQDSIIITTGEGSTFRPLWLNATKVKTYNVAEFDFPNINGTLVSRTTSKGARYALELYFQGDDNLDQARAFEEASEDPRPWVISHPFYGLLNVQPLELNFDNTKYNITKVTGTVVETILATNPRTTVKPEDNIELQKQQTDESFITTFDATPAPADINTLASNNQKYYSSGKGLSASQEAKQDYFNKFNKANAAINTGISQPQNAMRSIQAVINAPANFAADVKQKVNSFKNQYQDLKSSIKGISTRAAKKIYAVQGGAILSAHAQAALLPLPGQLLNRGDVLSLAEGILEDYNQFINDLDTLQSDTGGTPDSYIPDFDSFIRLNILINSAITGLFQLALNSRQGRTIILEDDTDLINLTHRLYGLDQFDNNINELIDNNGFSLNAILEIKKGEKVIYYI